MKRSLLFLALVAVASFGLKPNTSHSQVADAAKNLALVGATTVAINHVVQKHFEAQCSSTNIPACQIASMMAAQVVVSSLAKQSAGRTGSDASSFDPWGAPGGGGGGSSPSRPDLGVDMPDIDRDIRNNFPDLRNNGFDVDVENQTVTGPDGKSMPFSSLTPENLLAEGLIGQEDIEKLNEVMKAQSHSVTSIGLAGGGGGGGAGASRRPTTYEYYDPFAQFGQSSHKPRDPKTSGLSRQLGNTHVGIASDNIFEMIHRRYQSKVEQGIFVSP